VMQDGFPYHCSFCGRTEKEVNLIITGPTVCICNVCVEECQEIIEAEKGKKPVGREELAFEAENLMIPTADWETREGIPAEALQLAQKETANKVPTGIAQHPKYGWVVVQTSGQGPYIIWSEQELPEGRRTAGVPRPAQPGLYVHSKEDAADAP